MQWYEEDVRVLESTRHQRGVADPVVFYGSSTIRLWSTLAADLRNARAVNLGFGGSTLDACAFFFKRLVVPENPASLVVYAGDNDLGDGRTPEQVLASYRSVAAQVERLHRPVCFGFISIKPSPARFGIIDRIRRTNDQIEQETQQYPNAYFIPVFDAMLAPGGKPRPELFLEDGLHMGPAGYRLWTELLEPFRNRIFKSLSDECNTETLFSRNREPGISQVV